MPADIALDADYMNELRRREAIIGEPEATTMTQKEEDESIVKSAENPFLEWPKPSEKIISALTKSCLDQKKQSSTPK